MPNDPAERNRQLALRWFAAMNAGDLGAVVDELFAPGYRLHVTGGPRDARGPAAIRAVIGGYRAAFPDLRFTVHETAAEGDTVCVRWTAEGTHRGPLMGVEPSGARARWTGISWLHFADGRVAEDWVENDVVGMMQQLGAVPAAV
jgi:steroid delta-isomerase-like uncharacterized protein